MTLARRVAVLETSLTPTQLVLRWLDEAHSHGGLTAYVAAILDDAPENFPINRLCREAIASARGGIKGRSKEQTDAAVRVALQQTVFRFELVMRINVRTHELVDRQALVDAVLCGYMAMLASGFPLKTVGDLSILEQLAASRDLAMRQVMELHAFRDARTLAESTYLDRHSALFPESRRAWGERLEETERYAVMADRLAELDGASPMDLDMGAAVAARVPLLLADFVEPAKATALEKLGAGERASRIATLWVRSRFVTDDAPAQGQLPVFVQPNHATPRTQVASGSGGPPSPEDE